MDIDDHNLKPSPHPAKIPEYHPLHFKILSPINELCSFQNSSGMPCWHTEILLLLVLTSGKDPRSWQTYMCHLYGEAGGSQVTSNNAAATLLVVMWVKSPWEYQYQSSEMLLQCTLPSQMQQDYFFLYNWIDACWKTIHHYIQVLLDSPNSQIPFLHSSTGACM
jgi:hypothetical protein